MAVLYEPDFLSGGGEMGALMRQHDWQSSSLGPPDRWPQALRTVVRLMLNTGHPMYVWWGAELACLYNDAYRESIGPERHPGSLGRPAREVWEEIWDIIGPQIAQVMEGGGATWHVNQLVPITRHGRREEVYWTYSYSPIDDDTTPGGIGGVLVVCTETTQQIQAARRLANERDRLAQLFEQAPTFIAMLRGPDHTFELANPSYRQVVGHRAILGRPIAEALPEAVAQGYLAKLDEAFRSGSAYLETGAKYAVQATPGGPVTERFVDFVYQPIKDEYGRVTGIFVQGADVTDRTQAVAAVQASEARFREMAEQLTQSLEREQEARAAADQANRAKDEFLAMLGHELRNPLAPILTALELMRLRAGETTVRERAVIERQVTHLNRLVDDLLDVSRVTRGKIRLKYERIELADVVARAVELVSPMLEDRQQTLTTAVDAKGLVVRGDRTRLAQVVSNLLTNASKFGHVNGRISVAARREGDEIALTVSDDGAGISADLLPRIFDLFTQDSRRIDRARGGLGLGLAIVRNLVALHGGSVEASSEGPDRGSQFTVRLPAEAPATRADRAPMVARDGQAIAPATAARRILIVDDNRDAADLLADALRMSGHAIQTAYDGPSALHAARAFAPDLALLDIGLPLMDGYDVAERLKGTPGLEGIQLVALTGYGQVFDRRRSHAAGFAEHMVKPTQIERVRAVVDRLTAKRATSPPSPDAESV
jgi:signal transduction histidine kinase/CheY-like chemotaxis protein